MSNYENHVIYDPPISIPDSDLTITRYEPEGQTLILDTGRGLYVPGLADPENTAGVLASAQAALADPIEPPSPVPASVTKRQLRQWLITHGKLAAVETAISAIPDATQRAVAQNWWDTADYYERAHPLISQVGEALDMTDAEIDDAFREAATL
ncbi:hypothetical protein OpiT1DRAFT_01311 [Opitutaceae bacterium TAV1]|nr:hypothetical protein OpiT1DRAFT_01311 [Opitutaceae bacterium TAV1]